MIIKSPNSTKQILATRPKKIHRRRMGRPTSPTSDLKGKTQVASAVGKGNQLASEWSVFRMVIPMDNDVAAKFDKHCMDKIYKETKAESIIYPYSQVGMIMVWAKKENDALLGLAEVLNHFKDSLLNPYADPPWFIARLVITGAQASWLIREKIIDTVPGSCLVDVYLSDTIPKLSHDDVILEIQGDSKFLSDAISYFAVHLGGDFRVDRSMIKHLKNRMGDLLPIDITSAPGGESSELIPPFRWPKHRRLFQISHFTYILPEYACAIIGKHGENIECIRDSSLATIIIGPTANPRRMKIMIKGNSVSELEHAEEVIQGCLDKIKGPKIFERVFGATCAGCTLFR